jgi:hypothetical protein
MLSPLFLGIELYGHDRLVGTHAVSVALERMRGDYLAVIYIRYSI